MKDIREISLSSSMPRKDPAERRAYWNEWYSKNKDKLKEHYCLKAKRQRKERKSWWQERKKMLACKVCGENHPGCLDFHHINPAEKTAEVSNMLIRVSGTRLEQEILKCEVLCANCHRKKHYQMQNEEL